jgi:PKD repeat protein
MRIKLMILSILLVAIYSCSKERLEPISSFNLGTDTISTLKVATFDEFWVTSKSINADSVLWDFGDGRISRDTAVWISYPKSGIYTIKLIAKNIFGDFSESSKKVIVLDRVLKRVEIPWVSWDITNTTEGWPISASSVDIYFQIQMFTDNTTDPVGIYPNCPVLYTSSVVKNISNNTYRSENPIVIQLDQKFTINKEYVRHPFGNYNKAYLFSIMAKDSNGKIYCLTSSAVVGTAYGFSKNSLSENIFTIVGGIATSFHLIGIFE